MVKSKLFMVKFNLFMAKTKLFIVKKSPTPCTYGQKLKQENYQNDPVKTLRDSNV